MQLLFWQNFIHQWTYSVDDELDYFDDQPPYENDHFDFDDIQTKEDFDKMMEIKNKMYI